MRIKIPHVSHSNCAGSAHGQVDAERRFTDGTYRIADVNASDTRHLKSYTGAFTVRLLNQAETSAQKQ